MYKSWEEIYEEQYAIGQREGDVEAIKFMVTALHATKSDILKGYSEEEYDEAMQQLIGDGDQK